MSALNCKPGDLAVVVRAAMTPEMLGRFVSVVRRADPSEYDNSNETRFVWMVRSAVSGEKLPTTYGSNIRFDDERPFVDQWLKPIRDPGQDAQDETLTWLPVPSTTKEVA